MRERMGKGGRTMEKPEGFLPWWKSMIEGGRGFVVVIYLEWPGKC